MNTSSAGRKPRLHSLTTNSSQAMSSCSKDQPKCPTPRYLAFNIDAVLTPSSALQPAKPFKFLSFDSSASSPKHRRQPSVLIHDTPENYYSNNTSESISDEECITTIDYQKNSIFASTTDRKSSAFNSVLKKNPCEESFRIKYSDYQDLYEGHTKPDENFTTSAVNTTENGRDTPLGILPKKMYCGKCKLDITTVVNVKMPTLPFWKAVCCIGSVGDMCCDLQDIEKFQEFQHRCRKCKSVIASAQPI